jgi:O-antigen/teichoic acid export membrane protein
MKYTGSVKKNIIANLFGRGLSVALSIVFVPYYLKYLGAEAYGLVGLFAMLQSVFMLADMGLSGTFTRETARLSVLKDGAQQMRDLCRTFEVIFILIGLLTSFVIAAVSILIAEQWVNLEHLSVTTVSSTILLIGVAVGLQFPFAIYQGGMQGLQRQTLLNVLLVGLGLLRGLGAVLILAFVDSSIQTFFVWQVVISALQLFIGHLLTWTILPPTLAKPSFNLNLIRPIWRFAAGTAGITLTGILLTQVDKIVLTKMLPLEKFGYYTLASVVAGVPGIIAMTFNNAIYPRFTQLVSMKSFSELTALYHGSCQLLAVLVIPVGLVFAFFSKEIILVWTGSIVTAQNTFLIVSVLVTASTLMGLMLIPFTLQLAFGWTNLGFWLNIISVLILIPLLVWFVSLYGPLGAGVVWVLLYAGQIIGMIYLMHRRILKNEKWKWYFEDVIRPFFAPIIIVIIGRTFINESIDKLFLIVSISAILLCSICTSALTSPLVRNMILFTLLPYQKRKVI